MDHQLDVGPDRTPAAVRMFTMLAAGFVVALGVVQALSSGDSEASEPATALVTDELWVTVAAALVFFMQAGFLAFEVGLARPHHTTAVAMKNMVDWVAASFAFFLVGFAFMFGDGNAWIGTDLFALVDLPTNIDAPISGFTFFLFQLAFAGTAITIVSGSLVERTTFLSYTIAAVIIGFVIYPIFGRWAWASLFNSANVGWLEAQGFLDFAGATVVHSVGAWVALVGVIIVGPRIGRFDSDGTPRNFPPSNMATTVMGVLILWFGWWGFNGGSALAFDNSVPKIILATNLSGVAALGSAGLHAFVFQQRSQMYSKLIGGGLSGLVAITASANIMEPSGAIAIGLIAGVLHNLGADVLLRFGVDDALGVIPVHGIAGVWGTLAIAVFAPAGVLERTRLDQLSVQALGVVVCFVWTVGIAFTLFKGLERVVGLRVSPARELGGLQEWVDDVELDEDDLFDDELRELLS